MPSSSCNSRAAGDSQRGPQIEVPLADISSEFRNLQLDDRENRLLVRRAPGDSLLVRMSHPSMVFSPGETMRFEVVPHLLPVAADTRVQIQAQLLDAQQRQLWSSEQDVRAGSGEAVPLELTLPEEEGVYDIVITAQQNAGWPRALRQSLRWKRAIAERRVQLVVISRQPPAVKSGRELTQVLEIDPASSRWWEKVKLPSLPRFSRGLSGPLGNGMRETDPSLAGRCLAAQAQRRLARRELGSLYAERQPAGKALRAGGRVSQRRAADLGAEHRRDQRRGHAGADRIGLGHRRLRRGRGRRRAALGAASAGLLAADQLAAAVDHQSPRAVASRLRQDPRAGRLGTIARDERPMPAERTVPA